MSKATIVKNTGPTTLTKKWYADGTQADAGTVTIGIVDENGDTIVAAGTATTKTGSGATTQYTYALAIQTSVNVMYATWTRTDTGAAIEDTVEIIGEPLFTEVEAREFRNTDGSTGKLNSATVYPDAAIAAERDRIMDLLEEWTGVSWVPRYKREKFPGDATRELQLSRPKIRELLSVTVGGSSVATSNFETDTDLGVVYRTDAVFTRASTSDPINVVVEYEHGHKGRPYGVDRIAMLLTVERMVEGAYPEGAYSAQSEFGTVRLVTEGGPRWNVSRNAEVNQWVKDHSLRGLAG